MKLKEYIFEILIAMFIASFITILTITQIGTLNETSVDIMLISISAIIMVFSGVAILISVGVKYIIDALKIMKKVN